VFLSGRSCVLFRLSFGVSLLECRDLLSDSVIWSVELPQNSVFSNVSEDLVALLSEGRQLRLVRIDSGQVLFNETVTAVEPPPDLFLRATSRHLVVISGGDDALMDDSFVHIQNHMHIHGRIWTIRRDTLQSAWDAPVEHSFLRMMQCEQRAILPNAPVLVVITRGDSAASGSGISLQRPGAIVYDIHSGERLVDDPRVGVTLNNHWLRIDAAAKRLDLSFERRQMTFEYAPQDSGKP
jgi:hypothetical protein